MVKLIVFLARNQDLGEPEFQRHLWEEHLALVKQLPGLRRVVVSKVLPRPDGLASQWDAIAEDWFDDAESLREALSSDAGRAVNNDAAHFLDLTKLQFLVVEETQDETV